MKKSTKVFAAFTFAALVTGGTMFAQNANGNGRGVNPNPDCPQIGMMRHHGFGGGFKDDQKVIMGQVKSVDEKNGLVKVTNVDGKDVEVKVVPFTKIRLTPTNCPRLPIPTQATDKNDKNEQLPPPPAPSTISDIKKGDWVAITTYNTETKTTVANHIKVLKTEAKPSDIPNSMIDAK